VSYEVYLINRPFETVCCHLFNLSIVTSIASLNLRCHLQGFNTVSSFIRQVFRSELFVYVSQYNFLLVLWHCWLDVGWATGRASSL